MFWRADQYDTTNGVLDETFGNGVSTTRRVNALVGRPEQITTEGTGGTLSDLTLDWNDDGRLRARSEETEAGTIDEEFEYDPLGRLESWDTNGRRTGDFSYDTRGNLTSLQYSAFNSAGSRTDNWGHSLEYAGRARVFGVDGAKAIHDAHGRWTELQDNGSGNAWQATFNLFDLPTTMHRGGDTTRYRYDSFGNRVWMKRGNRTLFTFGSLFEKERDGAQESYVLRIMGASGPVAELKESSSVVDTVYVHHDHLGNRTMTTSEIGKVLEQHRYTPFGELLGMDGAPLGSSGAPSLQSGFGGHRHEDTGFVDMRGRHYDPEIGRFLTVDPVNIAPLNSLSYNGYAYVWNDPLSLTDPTGFSPDYSDGASAAAGFVGLLGFLGDVFFGGGGGGGGGDHGPEGYGLVIGDQSAPPPRRQAAIADVQRTRVRRAPVPREGMQLNTVHTRVAPDWDLQLANWLSESRVVNLFIGRGAAFSGDLAAEQPWMTWDEAGQYGLAVAEVGGSMLPGVGELMDIAVIMDSSEPTWARVLSGVSLAVNAVTLGVLPNFGGVRRGATRVATTVATRMCFEAGTLVETPDGRVRIEELMPGDLVYAYEEATGTVVIREVVQTFRRVASSLVDLTVADPEDGSESTISGTAEHPFFVPAFGEYVAMGDLYEGMELLGADGEPLVVVRRDTREGEFEVFNFEVQGAHNYFVRADGAHVGVLVHNTCTLVSRISESTRLQRYANRARRAQDVDRGIDLLLRRLGEGNLNPGIGSRAIGEGISEARHVSGARVYWRQLADETIEILGFSGKGRSQDVVIEEVLNVFGRQ